VDGTIFVTVVLATLLFLAIFAIYVQQVVLNKQRDLLKDERERGKKSLATSRAVIKGQLAEQLFPLSIDCPFEPADMRFFGQPFDYIVIDGYSNGDIKEVVFVEIKTGSARLSPIQRALRSCIDAGRVRWQTVTIKESRNDDSTRADRGSTTDAESREVTATE
jgi:predicted Holliday junction resolvase-like endonuclease